MKVAQGAVETQAPVDCGITMRAQGRCRVSSLQVPHEGLL